MELSTVRAFEVMRSPVQTIRIDSEVSAAADLMADNAISAVVVENRQGKPIGVITSTDIVRYEHLRRGSVSPGGGERHAPPTEGAAQPVDQGHGVGAWMTPAIFSVTRDARIPDIAAQMVKFGTHHMFVRSPVTGEISGVISSFDILLCVSRTAHHTVPLPE